MNLEEISIQELKALAFDQMVLLSQTQNNINVLQAEINKREQQEQYKPIKVEKKQ